MRWAMGDFGRGVTARDRRGRWSAVMAWTTTLMATDLARVVRRPTRRDSMNAVRSIEGVADRPPIGCCG